MTDYNPLVSILVPIYGVEKYIKRCAITLFEQSYHNIEYIFVNDCTPDNSISLLQEVIAEYPNRINQIRIVNHVKNKGLAAARNTAVDTANGDFLLHVDSDDYISLELVERLVSEQLQSNADIVDCSAIFHKRISERVYKSPNYKTTKEWVYNLILKKCAPVIWGRLIRSSLYKDNDIKCMEGVNMGEDWQVTPRLYYYSKSCSSIDYIGVHYFIEHDGSSYTQKFSLKNYDDINRCILFLESFFADKGNEYIELLNIVRCRFYSSSLFVFVKNKYKGERFLQYKRICNSFSSTELGYVQWLYRPLIKCSSLYVLHVYVGIIVSINNILKRINLKF